MRVSLGCIHKMDWLDCRVNAPSTLKVKLFPKVFVQFLRPSTVCKCSTGSTFSSGTVLLDLKLFTNLAGMYIKILKCHHLLIVYFESSTVADIFIPYLT